MALCLPSMTDGGRKEVRESQRMDLQEVGTFRWNIPNFKDIIANELLSDIFIVGNFRWRLQLYPNGNVHVDQLCAGHLSVYLEMVDASTLQRGHGKLVQYKLSAVNHRLSRKTVQKDWKSKFDVKNASWGQHKFMSVKDLCDPAAGFLNDGTLTIETEITTPPHDLASNRERNSFDETIGTFRWTIDRFHQLNVQKLFSHSFHIGDRKWRIQLYPKGNEEVDPGASGHLSLYLEMLDSYLLAPGRGVIAQYKLRVVSQTDPKHCAARDWKSCFDRENPSWGLHKFLTITSLNDLHKGLLVNGTLIVEAELNVLSNGEEKKAVKEAASEMTVKVVWGGVDFSRPRGGNQSLFMDVFPQDAVRSFRLSKQISFQKLKEECVMAFNIPSSCQRFWLWVKKAGNVFRFRPLDSHEQVLSMGYLKDAVYRQPDVDFELFLEGPEQLVGAGNPGQDSSSVRLHARRDDDLLLFFKAYSPETNEARYVGYVFVKRGSQPASIQKALRERGFPMGTNVSLYKDLFLWCDPVDMEMTFEQADFKDGDVIWIQRAVPPNERDKFPFPDVPSLRKWIIHNCRVVFDKRSMSWFYEQAARKVERGGKPNSSGCSDDRLGDGHHHELDWARLQKVEKDLEKCGTDLEAAKKQVEDREIDIAILRSQLDLEIKEKNEALRALTGVRGMQESFREYTYTEILKATNEFRATLILGNGRFGTVYKGELNSQPVAVKRLSMSSLQGAKEFKNEAVVLSTIRHPHVVQLLGVCADHYCLVYEYMAGGSLRKRLQCGWKPLGWCARMRIAAEVAQAMLFLHARHFGDTIHLDLKSDNIMLDVNDNSKISDVRLGRLVPELPDGEQGPGSIFLSPPQWLQAGTDGGQPRVLGTKADVHNLGLILAELLTGKSGQEALSLMEKAMRGFMPFWRVLDPSAGQWNLHQAKKVVDLAVKCTSMHGCEERRILPILEGVARAAKLQEIELSTNSSSRPLRSLPQQYVCPITADVMDEPVLAADGHTYERTAITAWLETHQTSPMTNLALENKSLIPNLALRSLIREWEESQPDAMLDR
ncbi:hypothetical protein CBR_g30224 [Chara braunii]|uniref:RING-type E3 ubiquitin transferase n=1 Tax=Chara braunii TaxID=69332 RepID=A0A388LCQ2_CHABU|nr:hypothetical protein CBR_g30224 [Chara braunii]|eukprot:GBG79962.1 hypothetical protein CBR_g30224 [Chara braunii]